MGSWRFKELLHAPCHPVDQPCYRLSVTCLSPVSTLGFTQSSTKSSCCPQHRAAGRSSCLEPAQHPMSLFSGCQSCQLLQTPGNHPCVLHCLGLPPTLISAPRRAPGKDSGVIASLELGAVPGTSPSPSWPSPTSTCWQICISLAIWFSSSLLRLTRLVRFVSRVCCRSRNGRKRKNTEISKAGVSPVPCQELRPSATQHTA